MKTIPNKKSIKEWSIDDRPREKLINKGKSALSNAELLAILIGSGNINESAVELSKRILSAIDNNLLELSKFNVNDFKTKFKGIGSAKAVSIIAALELGHRRMQSQALQRTKIQTSNDAFKVIYENLADLPYEEFWIIFLNANNSVLHKECISTGGLTESSVDIRKILKKALEHNATAIIAAHNHPSGKTTPSKQDEMLTHKIKCCSDLLNISLLDHIIIGEDAFYSFADNDKLF